MNKQCQLKRSSTVSRQCEHSLPLWLEPLIRIFFGIIPTIGVMDIFNAIFL